MVRNKDGPISALAEQAELSAEDQIMSGLAFAANTDNLIRWEELRGRLQGAPPGISRSDRCNWVVRLANGERLPLPVINELVGTTVINGGRGQSVHVHPDFLEYIRFALTTIASGSRQAQTKLRESLVQTVNAYTVVVPMWSESGGYGERVIAAGAGPAIAYSIWVLLQDGRELCQCQYSNCGKFFFRPEVVGRPRTSYCNLEHGRLGDSERAAERMRKRRRKHK